MNRADRGRQVLAQGHELSQEPRCRRRADRRCRRAEGFSEAIAAVFPEAMVQTCIVHLIRNSLVCVSWKDGKALLLSIKAIYRAEPASWPRFGSASWRPPEAGATPPLGQIWRRYWEQVIPLFAFPADIRK